MKPNKDIGPVKGNVWTENEHLKYWESKKLDESCSILIEVDNE